MFEACATAQMTVSTLEGVIARCVAEHCACGTMRKYSMVSQVPHQELRTTIIVPVVLVRPNSHPDHEHQPTHVAPLHTPVVLEPALMSLSRAAMALWPSEPPVAPSISSMITQLGLRSPMTCGRQTQIPAGASAVCMACEFLHACAVIQWDLLVPHTARSVWRAAHFVDARTCKVMRQAARLVRHTHGRAMLPRVGRVPMLPIKPYAHDHACSLCSCAPCTPNVGT